MPTQKSNWAAAGVLQPGVAAGDGVGTAAVLALQATAASSATRIPAALEDRIALQGGVFAGALLQFRRGDHAAREQQRLEGGKPALVVGVTRSADLLHQPRPKVVPGV